MDTSSTISAEAMDNGQQARVEAQEHSTENNIDDTVVERTEQQNNAMQHGKRHGHALRAKTKLTAKSSPLTSHLHTHTDHVAHHHHATGAAKSEQRHKPVPKERKKKTKFIVGDHEQDDAHEDVGVGVQGIEEEQRGQTDRGLEHDGHHSYHPTRHRHDSYPQKHQFRHQHHYQFRQQKEHQQPEPHQVHMEARLENQDGDNDPAFESIPNSTMRDHPRRLYELNSDGALSIAPLMQNLAIDPKQSSKDCQVMSQQQQQQSSPEQQEQEHQQEHHQHQSRQPQDIDVPENTITPPPSAPKLAVLSSTGSNTTKNDTAIAATSPLQLTSASNTPDHSPAITPPQHQTSQRLSRLLNPSLSNTSLPSLCKINPNPVLTAADRDSQSDQTDYDASSALSAQLKEQQQQRLQSSSSAITFVTQFLNSSAVLGARSHSDSNLAGTAATAAAFSSRYSRHHPRNGSGNFVTSVQSSPSYSNGHGRLQRPRIQHSMTTPPRTNNSEQFVISRFLTATAISASPSTSAPRVTRSASSTSLSSAPPPPSSLWNRRLPASLRMTSTSLDSDSDRRQQQQQQHGSPEAQQATQSLTSTSPSSDYSSPDGPSVDRSDVVMVGHAGSTNPALTAMTPNPWNSAESMSRTQQKLNLQRASSQDDASEEDLVRRGKILREIERIQREYRCVRMTSDPMMESLWRCLQ